MYRSAGPLLGLRFKTIYILVTLSVLRFFTEHRIIKIAVETQDVLKRYSATWTSAKGILGDIIFRTFNLQ